MLIVSSDIRYINIGLDLRMRMIVNRKEVKGMERRTARISKEPEVRRQEILDTAMDVFMEKGYEAATMRDIAAAMHVVPGLCYRFI